ncbi:unnamed protein product, partial [Allacma fusca]
MSFEIIDKVLDELKLSELYKQRFHDEFITDDVMDIVSQEGGESMKDELRQVVSCFGHRIRILNSYKLTKDLTEKVTLFLEEEKIQGGEAKDVNGSITAIILDQNNRRQSSRTKKRKRFYDEESEITDIIKLLKSYDNSMRVTYREQIITASGSMQPPVYWSTSTAGSLYCIAALPVTEGERKARTSERICLSAVLIWTSKFLEKWPRLLDTPGAIQQDFHMCYPLVSDNLTTKWEYIAPKLSDYFKSVKKSLIPFGISSDAMSSGAAFFMLAVLNRPKAKKVTQVDSVKAFIQVINPLDDIDEFARNLDSKSAKI